MVVRKLDKSRWQPYFDAASRHLVATAVDIEVVGPDIGAQQPVRAAPLLGITYDAAADALEIATERLGHRIRHPAEVYVEDGGGRLSLLRVRDADGREQLIRLSVPLQLEG